MKFGSSYINATVKSLLFCALAITAGRSLSAQTLLIVSGNGQIVQTGGLATQPLVVQLLNAQGQPFPGQSVSFLASSGFPAGQTTPQTAVTDSNGNASVQYLGANLNGLFTNYVTNSVIATSGTATVAFTETTANTVPGSSGLSITANVLYPPTGGGVNLTGPAGTSGTPPIQVIVSQVNGGAVPNIGVTIQTDSSSTGSISCKEGPYVLTDATGTATCTPLFGKVGTGTFTINVGGAIVYANNPFTVSVGAPGIIMVSSGNNQSGTPGQTLPLPIVAVVTDLAGNTLAGIGVNFTSLTPGGATFTNVRNVSDANGRVSASVILGNVAGPIQIVVTDTGNLVRTPATFTETATINISTVSALSGGGQTATINQPFAQPLVVQVSSPTGQPVSGATVTFTVSSGSATVSPSTAITGANGQASASVTAGPSPGPVTVLATAGGVSTSFSLTANQVGPTNFTYFNGASNQLNSISPGSIVTVTGQGLVNQNIQGSVTGGEFGPMPFTLAGVSVTINNVPAPLFNVSNVNGQQSITLQVPYEVPAGTVPIKITAGGVASNNTFVTVNAVSPGFFSTVQSDGVTRAIALRPNGTVVTPQNPAARGENVRVYLTGLGPVTPAVPTGGFSPSTGSDPTVTLPLVAGINNAGVNLVQAIYARNLVGVYELTIQVPAAGVAPSGSVTLSIAVQGPNGNVYSDPSQIVIQ